MHAITCVVVIKRIELFFYWHENIFAKRQIHMTEQKQIMLRQQRELISFSSAVPVSDFCFPAISSLNISWTINVIHTHHSQWHLHRCREKRKNVCSYFAFSFRERDTLILMQLWNSMIQSPDIICLDIPIF